MTTIEFQIAISAFPKPKTNTHKIVVHYDNDNFELVINDRLLVSKKI